MLKIGIHKTIIFPFVPKGKNIFFRGVPIYTLNCSSLHRGRKKNEKKIKDFLQGITDASKVLSLAEMALRLYFVLQLTLKASITTAADNSL